MTDSFKSTASDYRPAGGRGAFKQRSVGASDTLREMVRQANPLLTAHKRNADAIFSTSIKHLSDTEQAQKEGEESRRKVHNYEQEKADNVIKTQKDVINMLRRHKSEGYSEIMGTAIKMSPFSKNIQTFLKVAEIGAQTAYKLHRHQEGLQDNFTTSRGNLTGREDSNTIEQASKVGEVEGGIRADEQKDLQQNKGINNKEIINGGDPSDAGEIVKYNTSPQKALTKASIKTLNAIPEALDKAEDYIEQLKNENLNRPDKLTNYEIIKKAFAMAAEEYDIGRNYTKAGQRFVDKMLYRRDQLLNQSRVASMNAAVYSDWNTIQKSIGTATTTEDTEILIRQLTAKGSTIINPKTGIGYGYNGGKEDALIMLYDKYISLGKQDLADDLIHKIWPTNDQGVKVSKKTPEGKVIQSHYDLHPGLRAHVNKTASQNKTNIANQKLGEREVKGNLLLKKITDRKVTGEGTFNDVLARVEAGESVDVLTKWADNALIQLNGFPNQQAELKSMLYDSTQISKYQSSIYETADRALERNDVIALYGIYTKLPAGEKRAFAAKYLEVVDRLGGQSDYSGTRTSVKAFLVTTLKRDGTQTQIKSILSLEPTVDTSMKFIGSRVKALVNPEKGRGISVIEAEKTALLEWQGMAKDGRDDTNSPYFIVGGADNVNGNNAEFGNGLVTSEFGQKSTQQINSFLDGQPDIRAVLGDTKTNVGTDYLFDTNEVAMLYKAAKNGKGHIVLTNDMEVVWKYANSVLPPDEEPLTKAEFISLIWKNQGYPVNELPVDTINFHEQKDVNTVGYNSYKKKAINGVIPTQHVMVTTSWMKNAISKGNAQRLNQGTNPIAIKKYQFKKGRSPWAPGNEVVVGFRGEWRPNTISSRNNITYQVGDTVTYGGNQYVSNVIHKSHDVNPAEDPDNWTLIDAEALQKQESNNFMQSQFQGNLEMFPPIPELGPTINRGNLFWPEDLKNVDSNFINFGTVLSLDLPLLKNSIFATER